MLRILHDTKYDFIKYWRTAAIGTIAFIALGMVLLGVHHFRSGSALNYSVEFTGGTVVQVSFKEAPSADAVRNAVDQVGFAGSEVTSFGDDLNYLVKVQPKVGAAAAANAHLVGQPIVAQLRKNLPANPATVARAEAVGARVGSELQTK